MTKLSGLALPLKVELSCKGAYGQTECYLASNIAILQCNATTLMYLLLGEIFNRFDEIRTLLYSFPC